MPDCATCGTAVAAGSRYCAECGSPLAAEDATVVLRPPLWRRDPFLVTALVLAAVAFLFLAVGRWVPFAIAIVGAVAALLARGRVDRRMTGRAFGALRVRAAATREVVAVRAGEQVELFRARRELGELEADRDRLFRELGEAVYAEDETGIRAARTALAVVIERINGKEAEIEALKRQTEDRVQRAQAQARPTERVAASLPPEPARVPEPWPPPDEGDLPEPPMPSPGEPSPGPDEPAPPHHPPAPQTRARDT